MQHMNMSKGRGGGEGRGTSRHPAKFGAPHQQSHDPEHNLSRNQDSTFDQLSYAGGPCVPLLSPNS